MPAISDKLLNDGAASPVSHTFSVVSTDGSRGQWAERSSGKLNAFFTLYHEVKAPSTPKGAYQLKAGMNMPTLETVSGVQVVTRNSSFLLTFNFSPESTEAERKDLLAYATNFLANADVKTSAAKVEPFY